MPAIAAAVRRRVLELAGGRCEYCRLPEDHSPSPFAVDHIKPRSREGEDEIDNLALCCAGCNGAEAHLNHFRTCRLTTAKLSQVEANPCP